VEQLKKKFQKHKHAILFGGLALYILILGIGVVGEVLNVTWIKRLLAP